MSDPIVIKGQDPPIGGTPGDVTFTDGKDFDGNPGTEALRLCGDGMFRVRSLPETDPTKIVRALLDWTTRCLDAKRPPTSMMPFLPDESIEPEVGYVRIAADGSRASIRLETDGNVYVNDVLVENDDKLRQNVRRVLERMRLGGLMSLTPDEEAQLALLEKKRGGTVVRLVPNEPTTSVHEQLRQALQRADEFEEIVVIARPKAGDATAFCSNVPITWAMGGVLLRAIVRLNMP